MSMTAVSTKAQKGVGMEGALARWYAGNTRKSLGEFQALARRIAGEIAAGSSVLEVAPGPGYFAVELARLGDYRVTGLDISHTFVEMARRSAADARVDVDFRQGNVSAMPFENDEFDLLLCRAAFKNFAEPVAALREMHRVLKPGGRALIIDLLRDTPMSAIRQAVSQMGLGPVNRAITRFIFRTVLLKRAYTKAQFEELVAQTPFRNVSYRTGLIEIEVDLSK
jgi:ubiquinone/menaquinone biosynthesis C-methylase UbiE